MNLEQRNAEGAVENEGYKSSIYEIAKLRGFKSETAKDFLKLSEKFLEAAFIYEDDPARKLCIQQNLKEAISDKTSVKLLQLEETVNSLFRDKFMTRTYEEVSILADKEVGDPAYKSYQKILEST